MASYTKDKSFQFFSSVKNALAQLDLKFQKLKTKYIPPYVLAIGSSLIIGLLSFGGVLALGATMPVLWPIILPLAFTAFALSVVYEGEIYAQNIRGTFKKLFKASYLERQLSKECLLDDFALTSGNDCPDFFKEYDKLCAVLDRFQHKELDEESEKRKQQVEKKLSDMEKWFAIQLFYQGSRKNETEYQKSVRDWVQKQPAGQSESLASKWSRIKTAQSRKFIGVKAFCLIAAMMMGAGTSYLLVGAFMVVPFLAVLPVAIWPMLIAPMALLAGVAYGLLVYNAITDMISNKLLVTWYNKIRENFKQGNRLRGTLIVVGLTIFFGLAVMLSICTAGTWWTVAKTTPALFQVFKKMPAFIMLVINPLVSSLSILLFNVQNISDTSEQIDEATKGIDNLGVWLSAWMSMQVLELLADFQELRGNENWFQILNPIRILIGISYTPLRFIAFLGHILSIGVTSDRVAGVSPFVSGALGAVNEGIEDVHYFVGHEGPGTCDLVLLNEIPNAKNLHKLKMISKAAYVRVKNTDGLDGLYYVNKKAEAPGECGLISMSCDPASLGKEQLTSLTKIQSSYLLFGAKVYFVDDKLIPTELTLKAAAPDLSIFPVEKDNKVTATKAQMDSIQSLTGHTPTDKRFISIEMDEDNLNKLDGVMAAKNKACMLSTRQVKQIAALLPEHSLHDHDPLSLRRERLSGKHGHTHEVDIPTQILDVIFWPLHRLTVLWDSQFSKLNEKGCDLYLFAVQPDDLAIYKQSYLLIAGKQLVYVNQDGKAEDVKIKKFRLLKETLKALNPEKLNTIHLCNKQINQCITLNGGHVHGEHLRPVLEYDEALDKQLGRAVKETVEFTSTISCSDSMHPHPAPPIVESSKRKPKVPIVSCFQTVPEIVKDSSSWDAEQAIYLIERHKEKYLKGVLVGSDIAEKRIASLSELQTNLRGETKSNFIESFICAEKSNEIHNTHRFFINNNRNKTTDTSRFLDKLSSRVARMA